VLINHRGIGLVVILHILLLAGLLPGLSGCVSTSSKQVSPVEVAKANVNLAAEYFRLGRMEAALKAAKKAVFADEQSATANLLLALIYQQLEQPLLADGYFESAVEYVPEDSGDFGIVHNNYAAFLCQNSRFLDAGEHFLLAAQNPLYVTPQHAYENAGICALKGNRSKLAESRFRKALELQSDMPRSLLELAKIQYEAENFLSARAYFQRYHRVAGGDAKSLFIAMMIERKLGDFDQALLIKNDLKKRFPDSIETGKLSDNKVESEQ